MHGYIYDVFLHQKPYEKELIKIEHTLTDTGLNGHIVRLSIVNKVSHAVDDLLKRGVTTIVAVGGDKLLSRLADYVVGREGITIGLIPLGTHQQLATQFGIPEGAEACKTLSARLVRPVRLGKINSAYFIHSVVLFDPTAKLLFDNQFSITPIAPEAQVTIFNVIATDKQTGQESNTLSAVITPASEKKLFKKSEPLAPTTITCPRITISEPRGVPIIVDGQKIINTPATLETCDATVQVIMGRDRIIR